MVCYTKFVFDNNICIFGQLTYIKTIKRFNEAYFPIDFSTDHYPCLPLPTMSLASPPFHCLFYSINMYVLLTELQPQRCSWYYTHLTQIDNWRTNNSIHFKRRPLLNLYSYSNYFPIQIKCTQICNANEKIIHFFPQYFYVAASNAKANCIVTKQCPHLHQVGYVQFETYLNCIY